MVVRGLLSGVNIIMRSLIIYIAIQLLIALYDNKKPALPTDILAEFLVAELAMNVFLSELSFSKLSLCVLVNIIHRCCICLSSG